MSKCFHLLEKKSVYQCINFVQQRIRFRENENWFDVSSTHLRQMQNIPCSEYFKRIESQILNVNNTKNSIYSARFDKSANENKIDWFLIYIRNDCVCAYEL